jgi:multiple sugar transport system ATP-binding protein
MSSISVQGVRKTFGKNVVAVDECSLAIRDGEFFVLVGPSGSGKTTVLRMLAGLEEPDGGEIFMDEVNVTTMRPRDRDIAMVFQDYALYPHLKVRDNLGFGLRQRKVAKAAVRERVAELASLLELEELLDRLPGQLSGGQRQRVALGRAIAREPRAFLMDEPLSNLDANLRTTMRGVLAQLRERLKTTTVYVTHDQIEAMTLGDRVAVMRDGRVQQIASPREIYERPANLFVGAFIGSPRMNLLDAEIVNGFVDVGGTLVPVPTELDQARNGLGRVIVGMRPADLAVGSTSGDAFVALSPSVVAVCNDVGGMIEVLFPINGRAVDRPELASAMEGGEIAERDLISGGRRPMFTALLGSDAAVQEGEATTFVIDARALYYFDGSSGELLLGPRRHASRT